jgi:hypothetical protein
MSHLDGLRPKRQAFVYSDQVDPQFLCLIMPLATDNVRPRTFASCRFSKLETRCTMRYSARVFLTM